MANSDFRSVDPDSLLIAPSILAADFSRLGEAIRAVDKAGADLIHVDIMDGHFVPNLTIGPAVVKSLRPFSDKPFDCHLMVSEPENFAPVFIEAGADNLTVHAELGEKIHDVLQQIHELGCSAGLCLKPNTPARHLEPFMDKIDLVLVMTVEPGFGGQKFMPEMLPKIQRVREMINASGKNIHLEVDGGINLDTVAQVTEAGARTLVAGTAVFGGGNAELAQRIQALRKAVKPYEGDRGHT
ncbi:MAG: ribulose-phosphate 3-epimerase [Lentisphaeria bacterium]